MNAIGIHPLAANCRIEIGPRWEPPALIQARVGEIWAREKKRLGGRLTNGTIYSLAGHRSDRLTIHPCEYRHALARLRAPELTEQGLSLRPLAVTGVLICPDGVVLGRRSGTVAADAGLWEPAPAGGLSQPDLRAQVMEELEEELGVEASAIEACNIRGLIEDAASGVFDAVFRLRTPLRGEAIRVAHMNRGSDEYAELAIVTISDLPGFLERQGEGLIPALRPMLSVAKLL